MAVSNNVILNKMEKELTLAKQNMDDPEMLLKYISHIHLLCEVMLDNDNDYKRQPTDVKELKNKISDVSTEANKNVTNGDSIFDF